MTGHDFTRDGARTIARGRLHKWVLWLEESAAFHRWGVRHFGADVRVEAGTVEVTFYAGRYSAHAGRRAL